MDDNEARKYLEHLRIIQGRGQTDIDRASMLGEIETMLDDVLSERPDLGHVEYSGPQYNAWLGAAAAEVDPDAWVHWDVMGNPSYNWDQKHDHLQNAVESVLPPARNTNCLVGMRCPKCGHVEAFKIDATVSVVVFDSGVDDYGGTGWDLGSRCTCKGCGYDATVADFKEEA